MSANPTLPDPTREDIDAVAEAFSAHLNKTSDTWQPATYGYHQFLPALSADTSSVYQAALGVLTTDYAPAAAALTRALIARHPDTLTTVLADSPLASALEGAVSLTADRHQPEKPGPGCECGFVVWSVEHVAVMSLREALPRWT